MCRKNLLPAMAILGFGAGMVLSLLFDSSVVRLIVGGAAIGVGFWLLQGGCRA